MAHVAVVGTVTSPKVDLYALAASERHHALESYANNFTRAWFRDRKWDTALNISLRPEVLTVTTTKDKVVQLDAGDGELLYCQMNTSAITGKAESVSVFIRERPIPHIIPINVDELLKDAGEPEAKRAKIVMIETGKGGRMAFTVSADCVL